jgi:hypothetical protein
MRVLLFLQKNNHMLGLTVKNSKEKIVFTIDKSNFTEEVFLKMMQIARVEYLVKKAAFDKSIMELDEEIKDNWWKENKIQILKRIGK